MELFGRRMDGNLDGKNCLDAPIGIISERSNWDLFEAEEFGFQSHCYQLQVWSAQPEK
jgi:hypothetical protein